MHVFLASALVGGEWSVSRPGRFTPTESLRYPLDRRLSGPQSRSGHHGEGRILDRTGTGTLALSVAIPTEKKEKHRTKGRQE
jgi:hypothetical protein